LPWKTIAVARAGVAGSASRPRKSSLLGQGASPSLSHLGHARLIRVVEQTILKHGASGENEQTIASALTTMTLAVAASRCQRAGRG
jgi:hypothetical protein